VLRAAELVRGQILARHGDGVLPKCYTGGCTCSFLESLMQRLPTGVRQTAVYTKTDGIVDWHVCRTGDPKVDFEVSATHIGMVFNPLVYSVVAHRLAGLDPPQGDHRPKEPPAAKRKKSAAAKRRKAPKLQNPNVAKQH
jgi:hypothetical protein